MDGFISYPRTDNTVYPSRFPCASCSSSIAQVDAFKRGRADRGEASSSSRRSGKKQTTDHPPIYPTQALDPKVLPDDGHRKIYELVVRRFLATFGDPAVSESTRADIEAGTETYFVRGNVLVEPGFLAIYPYGRSQGRGDPQGEEGQELALAEARRRWREPDRANPWFDAKETQPPSRIGQGKLIEMMEELGLGTKATRHDIIQKLYDRGYVQNNPIEPSETGIAMVKAFRKYAERSPRRT